MTINIEVKGLAELKRKMTTLFTGNSRHIISYLLLRVGRYAQGALQGRPYPSERPGQTYRRTGQLNRAWYARITKNDTISIINPAKGKSGYYASYVVGDQQAWMHAGRWWQARNVVEESLPQAIEETSEYTEAVWNG